jgi:hypothetical protein
MKKQESNPSDLRAYYHFTPAEAKKYPVIMRVIDQLTPQEVNKRMKATRELALPEEMQKWVDEYAKLGRRNPLTWKRTYRHSCVVNFSKTNKDNVDFLQNTKFMMFMFIILLDDVADVYQSKALLEEILKIPYEARYIQLNRLKLPEQKYLKFTLKLWKALLGRLKTCPNYKQFEELFEYNNRQMLHGRRYGYLVNRKPWLINRTEIQAYLPASVCSMQILEDFTIDFMFAPNLDLAEYGKVRELIGRTQQMTRRGNWVSGWIKELEELDFTSGVVAYALDEGVVTAEELSQLTAENYMQAVDKIRKSNVEKELLMEWEDYYHANMETAKEIKSTDAAKYVAGIEQLLGMVLTSAHAS